MREAHSSPNWKRGAAFGAFGPVAWMRKASRWEARSGKSQAINASHTIAVYARAGAILGAGHGASRKPRRDPFLLARMAR